MAWPVLIIGLLLVVVGIRGETERFLEVVKSDLTGQQTFVTWIAAIFIIGAIGGIKQIRPISDGLLILVCLVLLLSNRGFFAEFDNQIRN